MKLHTLAYYFFPHPHTHQKAHLLHWHFLIIYILLFVFLRVGLDLTSIYKPGVLGISSSITIEKIVEETNKERAKKGLSQLKISNSLNEAAVLKAKNMFEENYWAHFSPSGKDPWGFILGSGYKFSYAGENLARNFYTSEEVVKAWMNSPSHRENLLNANYQDIGIGVVEGTLQGQKTTLVVQMFGKTYQPLAAKPEVSVQGKKITLDDQSVAQSKPVLVASSMLESKTAEGSALIDPFLINKIVGISLIAFVSLLLIIDVIILKKRGVFRLSSHHVAHLSLLTFSGSTILLSKAGEIL